MSDHRTTRYPPDTQIIIALPDPQQNCSDRTVAIFGMVQNQAIAPLQLNEQKSNLKQAKHFSWKAEVAKRQIV
jgi:hypothetical protein